MYAREQFHKAGPRLCTEECILTGDPDTVVHMHQSPADKKGFNPHWVHTGRGRTTSGSRSLKPGFLSLRPFLLWSLLQPHSLLTRIKMAVSKRQSGPGQARWALPCTLGKSQLCGSPLAAPRKRPVAPWKRPAAPLLTRCRLITPILPLVQVGRRWQQNVNGV